MVKTKVENDGKISREIQRIIADINLTESYSVISLKTGLNRTVLMKTAKGIVEPSRQTIDVISEVYGYKLIKDE